MSLTHLVVLNVILAVPFLVYGATRLGRRVVRFALKHFVWGKVF
jgi:hypothetical protein